MRRWADLAGRRFASLKVVKLSKERNNAGWPLWLCECDCGNTTLLTLWLRRGMKKSCGCRHWTGRKLGKPFTKQEAKKQLRATERVTDADGEWLSPGAAARYLGVAVSTLKRWADSCPFLDGAGIATRPFPGVFGRPDDYYPKRKLDEIKAAIAARKPVPELPGLVHIDAAAAEIGVSQGRVRKLRRRTARRCPGDPETWQGRQRAADVSLLPYGRLH